MPSARNLGDVLGYADRREPITEAGGSSPRPAFPWPTCPPHRCSSWRDGCSLISYTSRYNGLDLGTSTKGTVCTSWKIGPDFAMSCHRVPIPAGWTTLEREITTGVTQAADLVDAHRLAPQLNPHTFTLNTFAAARRCLRHWRHRSCCRGTEPYRWRHCGAVLAV